ncbi:radical SAM protein [Planctomycetota bacterium]
MGFIINYVRNLASIACGRQPCHPLLFSYYITHRCNLNCSYCSDGNGNPFKEDAVSDLGFEDSKNLLSILAKAADTIDITGGEPLLRTDLEGLLEHAKSLGVRTVLNTKGLGLQDRPDVLRFSSTLVLSLDALDVHKLSELLQCPVGTAQEILDSVLFAAAYNKQLQIVISCVATPENLDDVLRVLEFALEKRLGFHLSPEIIGKKVNPELQNNAQYRDVIDKVISLKRKRNGILGIHKYLCGIRDFSRFTCYPLLMPTIRPDGMMYYPCLEFGSADINLLKEGNYQKALIQAKQRHGRFGQCKDVCHIFCHMGISLFQKHPFSALAETRNWSLALHRRAVTHSLLKNKLL